MIRAIFRSLAVMLLCASLTALVAPMRAQPVAHAKSDCCAHMDMKAMAGHDCGGDHQTPSKERDTSCCQACALGLAMLFVAPPSFVYAQTGEENFLTLSTHGDAMPHRPPVPPPRTSLS
ncbi:MAG: hypothetical protein ACXWAV_06475 [Chthoniobacterales bacterium]